MYSLRNDKW